MWKVIKKIFIDDNNKYEHDVFNVDKNNINNKCFSIQIEWVSKIKWDYIKFHFSNEITHFNKTLHKFKDSDYKKYEEKIQKYNLNYWDYYIFFDDKLIENDTTIDIVPDFDNFFNSDFVELEKKIIKNNWKINNDYTLNDFNLLKKLKIWDKLIFINQIDRKVIWLFTIDDWLSAISHIWDWQDSLQIKIELLGMYNINKSILDNYKNKYKDRIVLFNKDEIKNYLNLNNDNSENILQKTKIIDIDKYKNSKNISSDLYIYWEWNHKLNDIYPQNSLKIILENTKKDENWNSKYSFDDLDTLNIMTSLKVKPFVILTWVSWVWKSLRVKQIAKAIYNTDENKNIYKDFYKHVAVKPNWTDNTALFWYYNPLTKEYVNGELNEFINKAFLNPDKPFFVMLDEINLARVEYYMSDILSHMEDFDTEWFTKFIKLYEVDKNDLIEDEKDDEKIKKEKLLKLDKIKSNNYLIKENWYKYEIWYILSKNVFFVWTANIDETTHGFSNKVLDRCSVIEIENDYGVEAKNDYGIDWEFDFCWEIFEIENQKNNNEFLIDLYLSSSRKNHNFLSILQTIQNKELIYEKILNKLENSTESQKNTFIFLLQYFNYNENKLLDLIKKYSEWRSYTDYMRQFLLLDKLKIDEYRKLINDECKIKPYKIIEDLNILSATNLVNIIENFNEKNGENIIYDLILNLYDKHFDLIVNKKAIPELFNIIYDFYKINEKYEKKFFDILEQKNDYYNILEIFNQTHNKEIINKIINLYDKYDSLKSSEKFLIIKFLYKKRKIKLDEYINNLKLFLDDDNIKFSASIILSNYISKLDDKTKDRVVKIFEEISWTFKLEDLDFILNDLHIIDNIEIVKNIYETYSKNIKDSNEYKNSFLIWLSFVSIKHKNVYDYLVDNIEEFNQLYLIKVKLFLDELSKIDNTLFSHRVGWDIKRYVQEFNNFYEWNLSIDYSLKQKILPKVKWDLDDLEDELDRLKEILVPYEKSSNKLQKMRDNWEKTDYITFWK